MITDFNIIFILVGLAPKEIKSCENYFGGLTYPSKSIKKYTNWPKNISKILKLNQNHIGSAISEIFRCKLTKIFPLINIRLNF